MKTFIGLAFAAFILTGCQGSGSHASADIYGSVGASTTFSGSSGHSGNHVGVQSNVPIN